LTDAVTVARGLKVRVFEGAKLAVLLTGDWKFSRNECGSKGMTGNALENVAECLGSVLNRNPVS
jgi:hypothetical protein